MHKFIIAAIGATAVIAPTLASAGSFTSTGYIASVNPHANTLRIAGGDAYRLPADVDVSQFRPGDRVHVTWDSQNPKVVGVGGGNAIAGIEATGIQSAN